MPNPFTLHSWMHRWGPWGPTVLDVWEDPAKEIRIPYLIKECTCLDCGERDRKVWCPTFRGAWTGLCPWRLPAHSPGPSSEVT
jgi:hypothetical protein